MGNLGSSQWGWKTSWRQHHDPLCVPPTHVEAAVGPRLTNLCDRGGLWSCLPAWLVPSQGLTLRLYSGLQHRVCRDLEAYAFPPKIHVCSAQVQGPRFLACRQGTHGFLSWVTAPSPSCTGLTTPKWAGLSSGSCCFGPQGLCLNTCGEQGSHPVPIAFLQHLQSPGVL